MRIKLAIIMILPMMLLQCQSSLWTMMTKKESKLYSEVEMKMLLETTGSVDFKFGYDPDLEIDYVYKAGSFSDSEVNAKSPEMKKVLSKYTAAEVISFYEKIVQLRETQTWKMNLYRQRKNWENSTFIQKYSMPETELFLGILEKNVIQINAAYGGNIEKRKNEIKAEVSARLKKELEDKEKSANE